MPFADLNCFYLTSCWGEIKEKNLKQCCSVSEIEIGEVGSMAVSSRKLKLQACILKKQSTLKCHLELYTFLNILILSAIFPCNLKGIPKARGIKK